MITRGTCACRCEVVADSSPIPAVHSPNPTGIYEDKAIGSLDELEVSSNIVVMPVR